MKKRRTTRRKPDLFERFQNNIRTGIRGLARNAWNICSWIGLGTLLYLILR